MPCQINIGCLWPYTIGICLIYAAGRSFTANFQKTPSINNKFSNQGQKLQYSKKGRGGWQAILSYCQKVDFQGHHIPIYNPEVSIKWSWPAWLSKSLGRRRLDCKEDLGQQATRTGHLLLRNLSARLAASEDDQSHTLPQPYPLLGSNSCFALTEKRLTTLLAGLHSLPHRDCVEWPSSFQSPPLPTHVCVPPHRHSHYFFKLKDNCSQTVKNLPAMQETWV